MPLENNEGDTQLTGSTFGGEPVVVGGVYYGSGTVGSLPAYVQTLLLDVSGAVYVTTTGTLPVAVQGNVQATIGGQIGVNNFPATQNVSGNVNLGNWPATLGVTASAPLPAVINNWPAVVGVSASSPSGFWYAGTSGVSGNVNLGNWPAVHGVSASSPSGFWSTGGEAVSGSQLTGSTFNGYPVVVAGTDGVYVRGLKTDASGQLFVDQGTSGTIGNSWNVAISDGTHGQVAVKPANTTASASDVSLVVQLSPNQDSIPVTIQAGSAANTGTSKGGIPVDVAVSNTAIRVRMGTYNEQTTNFTGSLKSTSASDVNSTGTGAWQVTVTYYDQTGAGPYTETALLNGTTAVNLVNVNHCYIEEIFVSKVGSGGSNVGTITLYTGTGGTGTAVCTIGTGHVNSGGDMRSYLGHHYTPLNKTSSLNTVIFSAGGSSTGWFYLTEASPLVSGAGDTPVSEVIVVAGSANSVVRQLLNAIKVAGFARITAWVVPQANNQQFFSGFDYADQ